MRRRRFITRDTMRSRIRARVDHVPGIVRLPARPGNSNVCVMHTIDRIEETGRCVLRVSGEVRLDGARELFERVAREDCERVLLDFTACDIEDRALSALADLLGHAHPK